MMKRLAFLLMVFAVGGSFAAGPYDLSRDGFEVKVETSLERIDLGRDFEVSVTVVTPENVTAEVQNLQDRFRGFSVAEDFEEPVKKRRDGRNEIVSRWRLVPSVTAEKYRLAPFVVSYGAPNSTALDLSFYTAPVTFDAPAEREPVTGDMEIDPKKDLPPLSWKLVGWIACALLGIAAVIALVVFVIRKIVEAVRVHRMSPIQRALYELDKLLRRGLPGRGYYKDFYVELTMVVRRYIERQHEIKAPNLTTEEFLRAAESTPGFPKNSIPELREFLQSADMVKFAGVEATPEMADGATNSARGYLATDSRIPKEVRK